MFFIKFNLLSFFNLNGYLLGYLLIFLIIYAMTYHTSIHIILLNI
jgi:hypothetical protein